MITRREMKRKGRQSLKKHYLIFLAACLIAACIDAEFAGSLAAAEAKTVGTETVYFSVEKRESHPVPTTVEKLTMGNVLQSILDGKTEEGKALAERIREKDMERAEKGNPAFARNRGILSDIVNQVTSGSVFITVIASVNSLTGSDNAGIVLLILAGTLLFLGFWFLLQNMYVVISRRIFLEGRCYEAIPIQRFIFLLRIKKWLKASWTMFVLFVFEALWTLTIAGIVIKRYSYFLVPFIVAENPDIPARQAITLSRKMMKGHKWECFVFEVSFLPWDLLGLLTAGVSNIFYANPYKTAAFTEYYAQLRSRAKQEEIEGAELLNDRFLYEKAGREVIMAYYGDVIGIMEAPPEQIEELKGFRGFLANYLGVLAFCTPREKRYEEYQAEQIRIHTAKKAVEGAVYPVRLFPIPEIMKRSRIETLHYIRHYSVWSLVMMFFIFSFIGWAWEVSLHLLTDGKFVNRGVLHGPWLPIYGAGSILILTFLNRLRQKPVLEFLSIILVCGTVEYVTAYVLEAVTGGKKWWDYSGYFLNLHGRICAEGLLVFGLGGIMIVYVLAPVLDNLISTISERKQKAVCILLLTVFLADQAYSAKYPNEGEGITDYGKADAGNRGQNSYGSGIK